MNMMSLIIFLTTRDGDNNILSHSNLVLNLKGEEETTTCISQH
jgi:hypothetical protein